MQNYCYILLFIIIIFIYHLSFIIFTEGWGFRISGFGLGVVHLQVHYVRQPPLRQPNKNTELRKIDEPQIRARLGTDSYECGLTDCTMRDF